MVEGVEVRRWNWNCRREQVPLTSTECDIEVQLAGPCLGELDCRVVGWTANLATGDVRVKGYKASQQSLGRPGLPWPRFLRLNPF